MSGAQCAGCERQQGRLRAPARQMLLDSESRMAPGLRKSLLITFSQSYLLLAVQFLSSLIIARLLTPREIGIFSVSMVLIAIAHTLRDFGVVDYIVQERNLTPARIRAAFTVNLVAAWTVAAVVFVTSSSLAEFYKEPGVELVMRILAVNFLLLPFGSIVMANLRREMRFASLAIIRVSVAMTNAVVSVSLAYAGFSYLSLALGAVSASIVNIVLVQLFRPKGLPWGPGLSEIRHIVSFGSFSSLSNVIAELGRGSPDLILGRLMGMEAVGFFGRATGLIDLFNRIVVQSIGYVALPHFASELRAERSVTQPYLRSMTYLTGVAWPFFVFLSIAAWPVVRLLYGDQWDQAVPLVRILCIGELFLVPFYLFPHLLISHGFVRWESFRIGLFTLIRALPLVFLAHLELVAVASGYAAMSLFGFTVSLFIAKRIFGVGLVEIWRATRPSLGLAMLCGTSVGTAAVLFPPESYGALVAFSAATTGLLVGWLPGVILFRHPILNELSLAMAAAKSLGKRKTGDD